MVIAATSESSESLTAIGKLMRNFEGLLRIIKLRES